MPENTPTPAAPAAPSANPISPDLKEAPNLDNELDDALSKAFTEKHEEPPPVKKTSEEKKSENVEPKANVKEDGEKPKQQGELPDPEAIEANAPGKSSQSKDGWNALRGNYKKARELLTQREEQDKKTKAAFAEKEASHTKKVQELEGQLKELSKYRTMVDIQADPEFVSKYDQPIQKAQGSIKEMLISLQVNKEVVDQVDFTNTKLMDEIIGHVGEHRDKITARKLQRKVEEMVDLMDKRQETLSSQKSNYQEFIEAKKKEAFSKSAEDEGRSYRHLEAIAALKDKSGNINFPFLNKVSPSEGASQPEIEKVNNHNKIVDLMTQKVNSALKLSTPEEKAELAVAAVASHFYIAQLKAAIKKIENLEGELQKISKVNSEGEDPKPNPTPRNGNKEVDLDTALENHFSRSR